MFMLSYIKKNQDKSMVADVTETRIVIPSLEFKTCMTIKS